MFCPFSISPWIDGSRIPGSVDGQKQLHIMTDASQAEMFMMRVYPKTCISLMNEEINKTENVVKPELLTVVEEFDNDFALLTELPPKIDHDHKIPLVEGIPPVNIRPYRHPSVQKDAIEAMVKELSEVGVI
ncbi:hypothetical protein Tco_1424636 [Tanacetum coccineum]